MKSLRRFINISHYLCSRQVLQTTLEAIKNAILSLDEMPNRGAIEKLADMPILAIDSYLLKTTQ